MRGAENGGLLFLYGVLAVVVSHQSQTRQADYEFVDCYIRQSVMKENVKL